MRKFTPLILLFALVAPTWADEPIPLVLDQPARGQPGDEFVFYSTTGSTQYHLQSQGLAANPVIGIWGPNNPAAGIARNQPGKTYIDRTLPAGRYRVAVVQGATGPYTLVVTKNSWWKKVFGW